jgi:hypothetical protein
MGDIVPRREINQEGVRAITGLVAGGGLFLLSLLGTVPGIIVGGAVAAVGLGIAASKKERRTGSIIAGAGGLGVISKLPFLGGFGGGLLLVGGAALFGYGVMSAIRFFRKLKTRT